MIYLGIIAGIFGLDCFIKRYVDKNRELMEENGAVSGLPETLTDVTDWFDETY